VPIKVEERMSEVTPIPVTPIPVTIVGCGVIGKHHARVLTRHPRFVVAGLVDPDPGALAAATEVLSAEGASAVPTGATLADMPAVDGGLVAVATPSGLHTEHATAALDLGAHVVIEKPLDVDLAAGRTFAERAAAAARDARMISVISQHRFDPASVAIKKAIDAGRFGPIVSGQAATTWWRSPEYYASGGWRGTWAMDGGAVLNQGVHTVDLMRWLLGVPITVSAVARHHGHPFLEVEDTAAAWAEFDNGAIGTVFATSAAYPGLTTRVTVAGTGGSAIVENDRLSYFHAGAGASVDTTRTDASPNQASEVVPPEHLAGGPSAPDAFLAGHTRQYDDIADALTTGRAPGVTVEEAFRSLALVRAIYISSTLGKPVGFADVLGGEYDSVVPALG